MWSFDTTLKQWAWEGGSTDPDAAAGSSYGELNTPAASNIPPPRFQVAMAAHGTLLFFFGGSGGGPLFADLWSFDTLTKLFCWQAGTSITNWLGNYGTLGSFVSLSVVPLRCMCAFLAGAQRNLPVS